MVLPDGIVSDGVPCGGGDVPSGRYRVRPVAEGFESGDSGEERCRALCGGHCRDLDRRQVGKTYDIGALIFADSIINPGTTTVWTAHRFKVARETFDSLKSMATTPAMLAHVDPDAITTGAGNETIPFRNGSRIVFAARERGAIRGFTKVRRLILDEAQILTESALSDMVPTMNQAENPQIIMMGTPPKP
jgi:hypothetical protein